MTSNSDRREQLYGLLGDLPDRDRPVSGRVVSSEETATYLLDKVVLDLNGLQPVPAYWIRPKTGRAPRPTVLYQHAHGGAYEIGKNEVTFGRDGLQSPPPAEALTACGYNVFCADAWAFGERRGKSESDIFKEMLWHDRVMWGMMVYDSIKAIDWVLTQPEAHPGRIATMGISMGSTMSWWLAALDKRVTVCVDICCLTDFQALIETRNLAGHGIYYYVPGLLKRFTTAQINALIAPRPHLSLAGNWDLLTPPAGLARIDEELRKAYADAGAPDAWKLIRYECGHIETAEMRAEALAWLRRWLDRS